MGDLFTRWRAKIDVYSQRAVDVYTRELADFRTIATDDRARAAMLDFAVFLRQRSIALIAEDRPHTAEDLGFIAAVGHDRAVSGVSIAVQRKVLSLHTSLTLREVNEVAGPHDLDDVMRVLAWFPPQIKVVPEDAEPTYTGDALVSTRDSATVLFRATIRDVGDATPGDIRTSTVAFTEGGRTLCTGTVGPLGTAPTAASASCAATLPIGVHDVSVAVGSNYAGTAAGKVEVIRAQHRISATRKRVMATRKRVSAARARFMATPGRVMQGLADPLRDPASRR